MHFQVLIDAIVRQTMVLVARLSTAEGTRSPLGHLANEVFSSLVTELERQGVSKKVVADMFGMALRRTGRSSAPERVGHLRGAPLERRAGLSGHVRVRDPARVLARFSNDEESSVRGILNDLVENGFVMAWSRRRDSHRLATEESGPTSVRHSRERTSLGGPCVAVIYREAPPAMTAHQLVPVSESALEEAVGLLLKDGASRVRPRAPAPTWQSRSLPIGESAGWEAAVVDHHRAVLNALAAKVTSGTRVSAQKDEVGGTTLSFDIWPGHPREREARSLLATVRAVVIPLWDEINRHERPKNLTGDYQVHFYCGQYLTVRRSHVTVRRLLLPSSLRLGSCWPVLAILAGYGTR